MANRKKKKPQGPVWHGSLFDRRPISQDRMAEFDKLARVDEQIKEQVIAETITCPPSEPMESIAHEPDN
jgi:hypothetical protein